MRKHITDLKDTHKGERCFIVGTGPSLKLDQLETLKSETTISMNGIVFAQDSFGFDPTYFCSSEYYIFQDKELWKRLKNTKATRVLSTWIRLKAPQFGYTYTPEQVKFIQDSYNVRHTSPGHRTLAHEIEHINFDLEKGTRMMGTGILDLCIPLAVYMGCNPIYLIGCDCQNTGHFYDHVNKQEASARGAGMVDMRVRERYKLIQKKFEHIGKHIYNLTPIDVSCPGIPKRSFDEII